MIILGSLVLRMSSTEHAGIYNIFRDDSQRLEDFFSVAVRGEFVVVVQSVIAKKPLCYGGLQS